MGEVEERRADMGTSENEVAAMVRGSVIRQVQHILRRLNSILKSIATAIPLGECLGEYKEHVEMTLKDLANLNVGDATGLIDLSSAE